MTEKRIEPDLLAECRNGSGRAFELLYLANQKRVFSVALNFFGGRSDLAEDVTQQVFLKIFRKIGDFRDESEFATWLYRITINACIDEQRKTRRFSFLPELFGFNFRQAKRMQDEKFYEKEISVEILQAVATLRTKFRLPILLKYVENLSYREIAGVLECSEGTVASRLSRGHKMLAQKLEHLKKEI